MAYNKKKKLQDNIAAIRFVLNNPRAEVGIVKEDEKAILNKYSGFGGLKFILNAAGSEADKAKWKKSEIPYFNDTLKLHQLIRNHSKDNAEYKQYMDSLKASVLTSFYTDYRIVDAISGAIKDTGINVDSFLEPSAGTGAFIDSFITQYPKLEVLAYEKDLLTGKILAGLHGGSRVKIEGFETIDPEMKGSFDLVASNIPFGDFAVSDPVYATSKEIAFRQSTKAIHNYFFLKGLDQVREGGLLAFIASQGVMNGASPFVRMELMKQADLVAAIRLPNNTFSDNAGTDVGSDLIVLQKHTGKKKLAADEELFIQSVIDRQTKVPNNKYFEAYPQNIICTDASIANDQYGKPAMVYTHSEGINGIASDLRDAIATSLKNNFDEHFYSSNRNTKYSTNEVVETLSQQSQFRDHFADVKKDKNNEEIKEGIKHASLRKENLAKNDRIPEEYQVKDYYSFMCSLSEKEQIKNINQYVDENNGDGLIDYIDELIKDKYPEINPVDTFFHNTSLSPTTFDGMDLVHETDDIAIFEGNNNNNPSFFVFSRHSEQEIKDFITTYGITAQDSEDMQVAAAKMISEGEKVKIVGEPRKTLAETLKDLDQDTHLEEKKKETDNSKVKDNEHPDENPIEIIEKNDLGEYQHIYNYVETTLVNNAFPGETVSVVFSAAISKNSNRIYYADGEGNNMDFYAPNDLDQHQRAIDEIGKRFNIEETDRYKVGSDIILEYRVSYTLKEEQSIDMALSSLEALEASMKKFGKVNIEYIEELSKNNWGEILDELRDHIIWNPLTEEYEHRNIFLSGDLEKKVEDIRKFIDEKYKIMRNITGSDVLSMNKWMDANYSVCDAEYLLGVVQDTIEERKLKTKNISEIPEKKKNAEKSKPVSEIRTVRHNPETRTVMTGLFEEFETEINQTTEIRGKAKSIKPESQNNVKDLSPRPFSEDIQFFHRNGTMVTQEGQIGFLSEVRKSGATFNPLSLKPEQTKQALLYITISETYQQLYNYEAEIHESSAHLREHLNQYYDEFVESYGYLNEKHNAKMILMDANGRDALALERGENGKFVKADIFDHPVSFSIDNVTSVETPMEALAASLNKHGKVNIEYMSSLVDMDKDAMIDTLNGHIFYNPLVENYEIKDRFIAGNVVAKAEAVKAWIDREEERIKDFPGYDGIEPYIALSKDSLKALEESKPKRIEYEELDFNFGERWIPTQVYSDYMSQLYHTNVKITYTSSMDEYAVEARHKNMTIWDEYCVRGYYRCYDGIALLKHALHNTVPEIKKSLGKDFNGNDIKVPDAEAIQLANTKIDTIRNGFTDWLNAQPQVFKEKLVDLYNNKFNCFVRPNYDGSHQTFPGLDMKSLENKLNIKSIYQSQKDCIWMLKQNGGGICDHEVVRP